MLTGAESSNQAFALLIPDYLPSEKLFYVGKSAWSTTVADENTTAPADRVEAVTNNYAYIFGLGDTSNPSFPLLADAPEAGVHTYTNDQSVKGGVWKGKRAVVVRCDQSGAIEKCTVTLAPQSEVQGQIGTGVVTDIFTTAQPATWLGAANVMMYPN